MEKGEGVENGETVKIFKSAISKVIRNKQFLLLNKETFIRGMMF